MYTSLITATQLHDILDSKGLVIVDCRYDLMAPEQGRLAYSEAHIPGAVFADVHDDLSGPPLTDSGRHPLPSASSLNALFSRLGIEHGSQLVVYDASSGAFAARLWWLLRYMGHESVALLDGGWTAWQDHSFPVSSTVPEVRSSVQFQGEANRDWLVLIDQVEAAELLIDSRDPARYRGEVEPIDPKAGHIPGAINHFWQNNLEQDGFFKPAAQLNDQFGELFQQTPASEVVFYCGSGVTACHNLLAVAHAGMQPAKLYAGSWSEWCSDEQRPIVQ